MGKVTKMDLKKFSERLRSYRDREKLSREQLAIAARISVIYLYYLENDYGRRPRQYVINALANALSLNQEEWNELLLAAGYEPISEEARESTVEYIRRLFNDSEVGEEHKEELASEIQRFVEAWKRKKGARRKDVKKAILPIAGWQPRLLSLPTLERTIMHAVGEIANSGISEIIAVVAQEPPNLLLQNLKARFPNLRIKTIVQEPQLGPGHAVQVAQGEIADEPFAVIFPNDVDPSKRALKEMVKEYQRVRKPMFAVNPEPIAVKRPDVHFYGVAHLAENIDKRKKLYRVQTIESRVSKDVSKAVNADPSSRVIVGRYILTAEIFDALQVIKPNAEKNRLELADALSHLSKTEPILAYQLSQGLLPLAPVRFLIEKLVDTMDDRNKFEQILLLTQKLSEQVSSF